MTATRKSAPAAARAVPINDAEGIFLPLFDPKLWEADELVLTAAEGTTARQASNFDSHGVQGFGTRVVLTWRGKVALGPLTALRLFTAFPAACRLTGRATVDGRTVVLFRAVEGGMVPCEPTSAPLCAAGAHAVLSHLELELEQAEPAALQWNLYWIGLVDPVAERALEAPLRVPAGWPGLFDAAGTPALACPWIASAEQIGEWKRKLQEPLLAPLRARMAEAAREWEDYEPEPHIREFLPVSEHLYRYTRMRDRERPLWDDATMDLAAGGYFLDRPEWSRRAARMLLAMAATPCWFEGPQGCFPGSDWHHVCFVESHCLIAATFSLQFVGGALTPAGRRRVVDRIAEAWELIDAKCAEPGYRWFMNQGVVFNAARLIGAAALFRERGGERYRRAVEQSRRDHETVLENYLSPDGHCCEGPGYFGYSLRSSLWSWLASAHFSGQPVEGVLPERVLLSGRFAEAVSSTRKDYGACLPLNSTSEQPWATSLLAFLAAHAGWERGAGFVRQRLAHGLEGPFYAWDAISLLAFPWDRPPAAPPEGRPAAFALPSGLGTVAWDAPRPGKLLLLAERASTGHHHYDRGSLLLEAGGRFLLPDPGMTHYSNVTCGLMKDADRHNVAHPVGLKMHCHEEPSHLAERRLPAPRLRLEPLAPGKFAFSMDLQPVYGPAVRRGLRSGILHLRGKTGTLRLRDEWEFDAPRVLEVAYQNYASWAVRRAGGWVRASVPGLSLRCRALAGGLSSEVLSDRIDWDFQPLFTLALRTAPARTAVVESVLVFPLS